MKLTRKQAYEILINGGLTTMVMGLMHFIGAVIYAITDIAVDPITWYSNIGTTIVAGIVMVMAGAIVTGICDIIKPEDESV